jgi:hypothetical protein
MAAAGVRRIAAMARGTLQFPPMETAFIGGDTAFREHPSGHATGPNWPTFLHFASRCTKIAKS